MDSASYISREVLKSEYDGKTYCPAYFEDLVHDEVMLPEHAPREFFDREILWNSVEMIEKSKNAQLARMYKVALPNEWPHETAVEVMKDYCQRNFVDKGMCVDMAIHESINEETGQKNLHAHIMMTLRPLNLDGSWGQKQRKEYILDENGERIRNKSGKGWKSRAVDCTDWNSRENAKIWREDLANTINKVNKIRGLDVHWEHRSYEEQGSDKIPTKHMGAGACALEAKGIRTERGDYNREVKKANKMIEQYKQIFKDATNLVIQLKNQLVAFLNQPVKKKKEKEKEEIPKFKNLTEKLAYYKKVADKENAQRRALNPPTRNRNRDECL